MLLLSKEKHFRRKDATYGCPPACIYGLPCCSAPQDRACILFEEPQEDRMVLEVKDKQQQLFKVISKKLEITIMIFIIRVL